MKGYYSVDVECMEDGRWVAAGTYNGLADSIEEAIAAAVPLARDAGLKSEQHHRAVSARLVGSVSFGADRPARKGKRK